MAATYLCGSMRASVRFNQAPISLIKQDYRLFNKCILAGDVLHDNLRCLCLSRARFPGDNDALVLVAVDHGAVGRVGKGIDVRWRFKQVAARVCHQDLGRVDVQLLVWIDRDDDIANVRLRGSSDVEWEDIGDPPTCSSVRGR